MQHDNGRRVFRRGAKHAVFEIGFADAQEAGGGKCHVVYFHSVIPDSSRNAS